MPFVVMPRRISCCWYVTSSISLLFDIDIVKENDSILHMAIYMESVEWATVILNKHLRFRDAVNNVSYFFFFADSLKFFTDFKKKTD
jgi:hypothetical protein